jgi:hypothetical protein
VPVAWDDQPGSTVAPLSTALDLGRTLVEVRRRTADLDPAEVERPASAPVPDPKPTVRTGGEPTAGLERGTDSSDGSWSAVAGD